MLTEVSPPTTAPSGVGDVRRAGQRFWEYLDARLTPTERQSASGEPVLTLTHPATGSVTGRVQVYDAPGLQAIVRTTLDHGPHHLTQIVAFADPGSEVPHLTYEASANPGGEWLTVDLIPRVAPTEHPQWTDHVYGPLSDLVWQMHAREDARQSLIRAVHRLRMSPWLLSMRLDDVSALAPLEGAACAFVDRFATLLDDGLPATATTGLSPQQLADRDAAERRLLYSWDATQNYRFLEQLGGPACVEDIQAILRHPNP
jgi:hypothetical protein